MTLVMARQYFYSVNFREQGGVLFEIATSLPGLTVDKAPGRAWYSYRAASMAGVYTSRAWGLLPPLKRPTSRGAGRGNIVPEARFVVAEPWI